jgi:hypothetical protein
MVEMVTRARLPHPKDEIESYVQQFNQREADTERTSEKLLRLYPNNTAIEDVLPKVVVLNHQYSTGILATEQVATHIVSQKIDPLLREGRPEVVSQIAVVHLLPSDKTRNNYSFASKYCAWHNACAYPIYDGFVEQMLWGYMKQDCFSRFHKQDLREYNKFKQIVDKFRTYYGLAAHSLKDIDKFLWRAGQKYFPRDETSGSAQEEETRPSSHVEGV